MDLACARNLITLYTINKTTKLQPPINRPVTDLDRLVIEMARDFSTHQKYRNESDDQRWLDDLRRLLLTSPTLTCHEVKAALKRWVCLCSDQVPIEPNQ